MTAQTPPQETEIELPKAAHNTPDKAIAAARFNEIQHMLLEAEKGNFLPLIPDYEEIPDADRMNAVATAVQSVVKENLAIIHTLQSTTATGPRGRKKTAAPATPKPASLDEL